MSAPIGFTEYEGLGPVVVEEEEDPDFDKIVAQQLTDQQFIEDNILPGDPGTLPPPPVQADTPTLAENINLPGVTPEEVAVSEFAAPAAPEPMSLVEQLFQAQNTQLPPYDPYKNYLQNDAPLTLQIKENQLELGEIGAALAPGMGQELLSMTPDRLFTHYQTAGITPYGPLAALNLQIAQKNLEIIDINSQLDAFNTENFTTQAEVDAYNALVQRGQEVEAERQGLLERYDEQGNLLIGQHEEVSTTLYGDDPTSGSEGLIGDWNRRYGPGGLIETAVVGEGLIGTAFEPGATPDIQRDLYNVLRLGYLDVDRERGVLTPTQKLLDAQADARQHNQIIQRGFTTQQFSEFAEDPGFQEFLGQITTMDASPELLDALGVSQVAARENPYGTGDPVPLQTGLLDVGSEYRQQASPGFGDVTGLSSLLDIPGVSEVGGTALEALFGVGELGGRAITGAFTTFNESFTTGMAGARYHTPEEHRRLQERAPTVKESFTRGATETYDNLPWYVSLAGEIVLDPLNLVTGAGALKVYKGLRFANSGKRFEKGIGKIALEDALIGSGRADADFLRSSEYLRHINMGRIDAIKLNESQFRFQEVANQSLKGVSSDETAIFSSRLTTRLLGNAPARWQAILDEELARLSERTGKTFNQQTTAAFNKSLVDQQPFSLLSGSEFWKAANGTFPKAMQDTPHWRQVRARNMIDPMDAGLAAADELPAIDNIAAIGHSPDLTLAERWDDLATISRFSGKIPGGNIRMDYLVPNYTPPAELGAVTDDMMSILRRHAERKQVMIERDPTTLDEYYAEWFRVTGQRGRPAFPDGRTVDDVVRNPVFQALDANFKGRLSQGIAPNWMDGPITKGDIARLYEYSIIQGRNLIDDLASSVGHGAPFSGARFKYIQRNLPATEWQKNRIRRLAALDGKQVSEQFLASLNWEEAGRHARVLRGKQTGPGAVRPSDIRSVAMDYDEDAMRQFSDNREAFAKLDYRAVIADKLTPAGEGRYAFVRPAIRPDGTTSNGWARMSDAEIFEAFRTAPRRIKGLETYGPAVTDIAEMVRLMARQQGDEAIGGVVPVLMADARMILDNIIDDVTQTADISESKVFNDWLTGLYEKSALPAPLRPLNPRALRPDNPEVWQLDRGLRDISIRQTERAALIEQQSKLAAISRMTSYSANSVSHQLKWREVLGKSPAEIKSAILAHFNNPASPMDMRGFYDLMRQMNFVGPGGAIKSLDGLVKQIRDTHQALATISRELAGLTETVDEMANRLGVDVSDLTSMEIVPDIQRFARQFEAAIPDYAAYDGNLSIPYRSLPADSITNAPPIGSVRSPEDTRRALHDSTIETAYAAARNPNPRPAWHYTPPITKAEVIPDGPRYLSRGSWGDSPEIQRVLAGPVETFNKASANAITFSELATAIQPDIAYAADDLVSQALLIHTIPDRRVAAKRASANTGKDISQATIRRAREEISAAMKQATGANVQRLAQDSKGLGKAIEAARNVAEVSRNAGLDVGKVEVVGGKVRLPEGLIKPVLDWIERQARVKFANMPDLKGKAFDVAENLNRLDREFAENVLGPVLDFMIFGVTSNTALSDQVMKVLGSDGARFIRPSHQRAMVTIFDPLTAQLPHIDWTRHGAAFDAVMSIGYDIDPVWGKMAKRFDPRHQAELTKMSKGVKIGDLGAFISHLVYRNIYEMVARNRENVTDIYSDILNHMDEIVDGGPAANALYSGVFDNSEEMALWLKWARAQGRDGKANWEAVRDGWQREGIEASGWGNLTPHLSISRMPSQVRDLIFTPSRHGAAFKGVTIRKHTLNRAPVLDDVTRLEDFIFGRLDLGDIDDATRIEADLWRDALSPRWKEIKTQLTDGVSGKFRRGVHVEDLDALFQLDAIDPFDAQKFSDNLGTAMAERELWRLGYDPDNIPALLKASQFIKHTLGYVWLRLAPRYVINNIFGNYMSILLNFVRSERGRGLGKVERVASSLDKKSSSVLSHRYLNTGIAGTEFGRGGAPGELARRMRKGAPKELLKDPNQRLAFKLLSPLGQPVKAYTNFNARATDFFELDARARVWMNEFDYSYTRHWQDGLNKIRGIDSELRDQIAGQLELADVAKALETNGVDDATRQRVFAAHNESIAQGHLRAYHVTREVMRDYLMRNRFDNIMDQVFPYGFWMTKNLGFVTGTVLDRPATLIQGMRVYDTWAESWDGMPHSFKNKLQAFRVPGFMPGIGGQDMWLRPNNLTNPAFFILPAVVDEMRDAWARYEDTPLFERMARTSAGGLKQAWEEIGYSPGPHWDIVHGGLQSGPATKALAAAVGTDDAEYFQDLMARGYGEFMRPRGFEQELLPLGGLEDVGLMAFGGVQIPGTNETLRGIYARGNQLVKGSPYTRFEVNKMGQILADMAKEGQLGSVEIGEDEYGNPTFSSPDETMAEFWRLHDLIVLEQSGKLEADDIGKQVLDRLYKEGGTRSGYNYFTGLSMTLYSPSWRESSEAQDVWSNLRLQDDLIPVPPGATMTIKTLVTGLNAEIEDAQAEQQRHLEINDFSPQAVAEATDTFRAALRGIYTKGREAGIDVPQLRREGPNAANEWAFGTYDPQTGRYENAHAPWLMFNWAANDTPADVEARRMSDIEYQQEQAHWDNINNAIRSRQERYGKAAPYWNDIDAVWDDETQKLNRLYQSGLPENVMMLKEDQIMDGTSRALSKIYDAAAANGVSLKGSGIPPRQTSWWYDMEERFGTDMRALYQRTGLEAGLPELLSLDDAVQLHKVEDQITVHTWWAMRQTIDALDLNPYLPGGTPNPKFMVDGHFERERWEAEVQKMAPRIMTTYDGVIDAYLGVGQDPRRPMGDTDFRVDLLARRDITFEEFFAYAKEDTLPRQSAYDLGFQAQLDKVFGSSGEERENLIEEGVGIFGPRFGETARGQRVKIDMDEVARTITNFYNGLEGEEQSAFEREWGHVIADGGDIKAITSEKLGYTDALQIADTYGLDIPTYETEWQKTRGRTAIDTMWKQLSKNQQSEWKETLAKDERFPDDLILTLTDTDEESGEPYSFEVLNVDELTGEQVRLLVDLFEVPLDSLPDTDELQGGTVDRRTAGFNQMMATAVQEKRVEVEKDMFISGEAWLDDPQDIAGYQEIEALKDGQPDLYEAGRKIIEETGVSWEWLAENLEPRAKAAGQDDMTLGDFAKLYLYTLDEVGADQIYNKRAKWLISAEGQGFVKGDPAFYALYMSDKDPLAEDFQMQAQNGTLFGFEGEDLENWESFYSFIDGSDHLYTAAQQIRSENDWTWRELTAALGDGPIKDFALEYQKRLSAYDMPRLWDQRARFFTTEFGQSIIARDPETFGKYVSGDGAGPTVSGGTRSRRGTSGGSFSTAARRPSSSSGSEISSYYGPIRDIFQLDHGMMTGEVPDAQQRFDVASKIADLIQAKVQWSIRLFGENNPLGELIVALWLRSIKSILTENPDFSKWTEALNRLGGGEPPAQPSEELKEQAGAAELEPVEAA